MKKLVYLLLLVPLVFTSCEKNEDDVVYELTTSVSPAEGGSISPSGGMYDSGEQITLLANPAMDYAFKNWTGYSTGTTNPLTVTFNSDIQLTAVFEKTDTDQDGVTDDIDQCPNTPEGEEVDADGCPLTQPGELSVVTIDATDVTPDDFIMNGEITSTGGLPISNQGFYVCACENPTSNDDVIPATLNNNTFSANIGFYELGVTMSYKAFATNENGTQVGEVVTADFVSELPEITISEPIAGSSFPVGSHIAIAAEIVDPESFNAFITEVYVYVDGNLIFEDDPGEGTYTINTSWDTQGETLGNHEITIIAYDLFGDSGSASVNIILE